MDAHRSNRERTQTTRRALLEAARGLFVERGYAETSTPDICVAAGITRGALYHHFVDKRDLFRHVLAREAEAVAADIEASSSALADPRAALLAGSQAYLAAMAVPGRTRLLLIDGPAVLGLAELTALDDAHAARTLREGLGLAMRRAPSEIDAYARLLSAAFDRAALEIDAGADPDAMRAAMQELLARAIA